MKKIIVSVVLGTFLIVSPAFAEGVEETTNEVEVVEEEVVQVEDVIKNEEEGIESEPTLEEVESEEVVTEEIEEESEEIGTEEQVTDEEATDEVVEEELVESPLDLTGFVDFVQGSIGELSEDEDEKLAIIVEFLVKKEERAIELIEAGSFDEAAEVLELYNKSYAEINEMYESRLENELEIELEDEVVEVVEEEEVPEEIVEKISKRGDNLRAKIEEGKLPAPALAGMQKALDNQARAMENRQRAKDRKAARNAENVEEVVADEAVELVVIPSEDIIVESPEEATAPVQTQSVIQKVEQQPKPQTPQVKGNGQVANPKKAEEQKPQNQPAASSNDKNKGNTQSKAAQNGQGNKGGNGKGNSSENGNGNAGGNGKGNSGGNDQGNGGRP